MKVIRWPELDILESNLEIVDDFWTKTNKGPILLAFIFPFSEMDKLVDLKSRIVQKKKELSDIEGGIYKVSRIFK